MAERLKQGLLGLSLIVLVGMALSGGGQELWAAEPDAWTLLFQEGVQARDPARYAEAEPLLQRALAEAERVRSDDSRVALAANNLGLLYHDQGRLAEAQSLYSRALGIWE